VRHDLCLALICCTQDANPPHQKITVHITLACKEQDRGPVDLLHGLRQGKLSSECACVTYCSTLTQGLTLVYDKKYSYSTIVRKLDLTSEVCGSYIIKKLVDSENPLWASS
jgi:hypothetical protein